MMKFSIRLFFLSCLLFLSQWVSASHFMGVDVTYECLGPCTYRIYFSIYLDCLGAATTTPISIATGPTPTTAFVTGLPGGCVVQPLGAWIGVSAEDVTPICPGSVTSCTSATSTALGVVGYTWYQDYNICPSTCTSFQINWGSCCRNYAITSGAGGDGIYTQSTTITPNLTPCNSSPSFGDDPVPYICAGQAFTFSQGAFDVDGDSLVYSLGPCFASANQLVTYNAGYSATSPLGPGWNVSINSNTGIISVSPTPGGGGPAVGVLCVYVQEWRIINCVPTLIGTVSRDMQFTVIQCTTPNVAPSAPVDPNGVVGITNIQNGITAAPTTINTCASANLSFDFTALDPDPGQLLDMVITTNLAGTNFYNVANPAQTGTITGASPLTGHVTWAVPTTPGTYYMTFTMKDNNCPIYGKQQYTVTINVTCCNFEPIVTADINNCTQVHFQASPNCVLVPICSPPPVFSYTWTGINFPWNMTGDDFVYDFLLPGTYIYQVTVSNGLGGGGSILDTIVIANNTVADAGPDISLCPAQLGVIGTPSLTGYSYSWFSNPPNFGFIGSTNIAQPSVQVISTVAITTPVEYMVIAIDSLGCPNIDTMQVNYEPTPQSMFSLQSPICAGSCASVDYAFPPLPGATYNWSFNGGLAAPGGNFSGPHQVCYPTAGTYDITLQVTSQAGCTSNITTNAILVNPVPTTTFTIASPVCELEETTITYTGTGSPNANYSWNFDGGIVTSGAGQGPYTVYWTTPGLHYVTLNVSEFGCVGAENTQSIVVNEIPTACFSVPDSVCAGISNQVVYTCSSPANAVYNWDFGTAVVTNGSGQGPYDLYWTTPGTYQICLTVIENGCTSTDSCLTIHVLPVPVAAIAPVGDSCFAGHAYNFTYTGTPLIPGASSIFWDFGNSAVPATSNQTNPSGIVYMNPGNKTVTVTVMNDGCTTISSAFVNFDVVPMPVADFTISSTNACLGDSLLFCYSGPSMTPLAFSWDFGPNANNQFSTLPCPGDIQFDQPGFQTITLVVDHFGCRDTSTQQVYVRDAPQVNAGIDVAFCEGDGPVQLDATVVGGAPNYGYAWEANPLPGGFVGNSYVEDPYVNPTGSRMYYVQVTDAYGCKSNKDSVFVTVKPKPIADAGPNKNICDAPNSFGVFLNGGLAANNQAPGPYQYSWTPNGIAGGMLAGQDTLPSPFVRPQQTQIYTLIVSSANGCSSVVSTLDTVSTTTVYVNPMPIVEAGAYQEICYGDIVTLYGFVQNAGPLYAYQWTPNDANTNITNANAGVTTAQPNFTTTFTLSVTSNGCIGTDTATVRVFTRPTGSIHPPVADICQGASLVVDGKADGDPFGTLYNYSWTPALGLSDANSATPTASPNSTTDYILTVSSDQCVGYKDTLKVIVKPTPIANILTQDTLICGGDAKQIMLAYNFVGTTPATPVVFNWTPATNIDNPNIQNPTVTPIQTTTYTVSVSIAGECPTTDNVKIEIAPPINALATADTLTICGNAPVGLHASGGYGSPTYHWSPVEHLNDSTGKDVIASPSVTTNYILTVQEGNCSDKDTLTITVNPMPTADAFATNLTGCAPFNVQFSENATNELTYLWNFGDGTPVSNMPTVDHTFTQAGNYVVTFTAIGAGNCQATYTLPISVADTASAGFTSIPPVDSAMQVPTANVVFTDVTPNANSWMWDFGDGTISAEQNPTHTYQMPGEYTVTLVVTNTSGCVSHVIKTPYVVTETGLFIPNLFTPNGDGFYDTWNIQYMGKQAFEVAVFDRWGVNLFNATSPEKTWDGNDAKGRTLAEGVYFYTIKIGDKVYNGNVTLMR